MTRHIGGPEPIELRAVVHCADGTLEVVAARRGGRWLVAARAGAWRGFGIAPVLGRAVDAALRPYDEGASRTSEQRDGS